jgi:hypothetical protein
VLVLAVGQFVSSALSGLLAAPQQSGVEFSPLIPPGAMFSIWGVILILSLTWAALQVRPSVRDDEVRDALAPPLIVAFSGFSLWLVAAAGSQSNWLTLPVFVLLIGGLLWAVSVGLKNRAHIARWATFDRVLLWTLLGMYTGWASVAIFINVAVVVQATGAPITGTWGLIWQVLVALAAVGLGVMVAWRTGNLVYAATVCYALVGAIISTLRYGFPVLAAVCAVGIVGVVVTTVVARSKADRTGALRLRVDAVS